MALASGIALWLVPEDAIVEPLEALVSRFAKRFASPAFEPHVTLIAGVSGPEETILQTARALAGEAGDLEIELSSVGFHHEYFKAAVLEAERTPALLSHHAAARGLLGPGNGRPYLPHLSLLYCDPDLIGEADREFVTRNAKVFEGRSFVANSLEVVRTDGPVSDWKLLASIPIVG